MTLAVMSGKMTGLRWGARLVATWVLTKVEQMGVTSGALLVDYLVESSGQQ